MGVFIGQKLNQPSFEISTINTIDQASHFISSSAEGLKNIISEIFKKTYDFFYEGSIFHALDNDRLKSERVKNLKLTTLEGAWKGVKAGAHRVTKAITALLVIASATSLVSMAIIGSSTSFAQFSFFEIVIVGPIIEEILFRGILQNALKQLQISITNLLHADVLKNRVVSWLVSPACRIVCTSTLFAALHLSNAGLYMTTAQAVTQAALTFLWPVYSILYETDESITAPMTAHITNNFLAVVL